MKKQSLPGGAVTQRVGIRNIQIRYILAAAALAILILSAQRILVAIVVTSSIAVAVIIANIIEKATEPQLSLRDVYNLIHHRCDALASLPRFRDLPRDILHNYIVPMANNPDLRTVQTDTHDRVCFEHATINFHSRTLVNAAKYTITGPTRPPANNPLDYTGGILSSKRRYSHLSSYLGGHLFRHGQKIRLCTNTRLIRLAGAEFTKFGMERRMIILLHGDFYTFINPINLATIRIPASRITKRDRKYLNSRLTASRQ